MRHAAGEVRVKQRVGNRVYLGDNNVFNKRNITKMKQTTYDAGVGMKLNRTFPALELLAGKAYRT